MSSKSLEAKLASLQKELDGIKEKEESMRREAAKQAKDAVRQKRRKEQEHKKRELNEVVEDEERERGKPYKKSRRHAPNEDEGVLRERGTVTTAKKAEIHEGDGLNLRPVALIFPNELKEVSTSITSLTNAVCALTKELVGVQEELKQKGKKRATESKTEDEVQQKVEPLT